jgi:undecaprenyl-diphosphatase
MNWLEALILGLVQGLTEFLPVSSSGHLEIGKALLHIEARDNLTFSIVVHGATVLSILVVFFNDLKKLLAESLTFRYNESSSYVLKILLSMVPVAIVGVFFKTEVEAFFTGNIVFVGAMLLITATLLTRQLLSCRASHDPGPPSPRPCSLEISGKKPLVFHS